MGARRYRPGMADPTTRAIAKYDPVLVTVAWGPTPLGPAMASASPPVSLPPAARTEAEQHAEVLRRRALADAGGATVYPSDEVEAEMLAEEAHS